MLWRKYMIKATSKLPVQDFIAPPSGFGSYQGLKDGVPLTTTVKTEDVTNQVLINGPDGAQKIDGANGATTNADGTTNVAPAASGSSAANPAPTPLRSDSDKPR